MQEESTLSSGQAEVLLENGKKHFVNIRNTAPNMQCNKCGRKFLSTTRVPGNCPDCDSSDTKKI